MAKFRLVLAAVLLSAGTLSIAQSDRNVATTKTGHSVACP